MDFEQLLEVVHETDYIDLEIRVNFHYIEEGFFWKLREELEELGYRNHEIFVNEITIHENGETIIIRCNSF